DRPGSLEPTRGLPSPLFRQIVSGLCSSRAGPFARIQHMDFDFDLLVIGSGPAGQKAAIQAAKLGRRVAVVERRHMVGGVCTNTGPIPSKTLLEAVLYLTGMNQREIYGDSYRVKADVTIRDLAERTDRVIAREIDVIRNQLQRNHVALITGEAGFADAHTVEIRQEGGATLTP